MKRILLLLSALTVFSLLFFMVSSERAYQLDLKQKGESFMEGMRIVHKKNGRVDWTLSASRADFTSNGQKARLSGLVVGIPDQELKVSADRGVYDMEQKKLIVNEKVVAQGEGFSIVTSGMDFNSTTGKLGSSGDVTISTKRFDIEGKEMKMEENGQKVRITRDVKAVFHN